MNIGDIVQVRNPEEFISKFAKKFANRDGVVMSTFGNEARVKFLKRKNRGNEFELMINKKFLVLKPEIK